MRTMMLEAARRTAPGGRLPAGQVAPAGGPAATRGAKRGARAANPGFGPPP